MDPAYDSSQLPSTSPSGANALPGGIANAPSTVRKTTNSHGATPKIRRRNRLITSCLECRRRKLKCDKTHPCSNCTKFVRDCVFLAPALDPASQLKLAEIKEKMGSLERTLEEDVAKRKTSSGLLKREDGGHLLQGLDWGDSSEEETTPADDEKDLEPTPLAVPDAAYYEDADDDVLVDLGVKIGKMRLTDRIGGFVRPKIHREVSKLTQSFFSCVTLPLVVDGVGDGKQPKLSWSNRLFSHRNNRSIYRITKGFRGSRERLCCTNFKFLLRT